MLAVDMEPLTDLGLLEGEAIRPISRADYHRMLEVGIVAEGEKVELLCGMLVTKMTQKGLHAGVVEWLTSQLIRKLDESYRVRCQLPYAASKYSEPEPDIVVAPKGDLLDHPSSLLRCIEVAESSLRKDRNLKLRIYAAAKVPEYWIVDINTMTVEVYTQPAGDTYAQVQHLRDGDVLYPTQLPGITLAVAEIPR